MFGGIWPHFGGNCSPLIVAATINPGHINEPSLQLFWATELEAGMSKPIPSQMTDLPQPDRTSLTEVSYPDPANFEERRQTPRLPLPGNMFIVRVGGLPATITVKDISCGGASGLMCEPLNEGTRLLIELDNRHHVEAEVRWVSKMAIGLQFLIPLHPAFVATLWRRHGLH
jgi:hypothetical protein